MSLPTSVQPNSAIAGGVRSISFTLPGPLPVSANVLHRPEYRGSRMVGMRLTDEANRWQQKVMQQGYIPRFEITKDAVLKLEMDFHFDWTKRRFDVTNLWKLVQDTIAKRLGFNDKAIRYWEGSSQHNGDREYIEVILLEVAL